jgi:protoporphyrinogen oxidase
MQIFFKGNIASTIILPKYGLSESIIEPAAAFINSYNGKIVTSETIKEVVVKNQKVISVNSENKSYTNFDFVISAIPFYALQKIISRESLVTDIELQYSTIINIHFWFNDFKMTEKFYGLLNSPLHWIFNKNNYINVVISDADYLSGKSKEEIFNFVVNELVKYFTIKKESITYYKIIKEKRATFIPEKSIICKRPKSKTNIKNLFLAGDWIDTGLPSTIESAAKSGRIAAELVLNETK